MTRFERGTVGIGLLAVIVTAATFVSNSMGAIEHSKQIEQRDWVETTIVEMLETNPTLSVEEAFEKYARQIVDDARKNLKVEHFRRGLTDLMLGGVVAYGVDGRYFLTRSENPNDFLKRQQSERLARQVLTAVYEEQLRSSASERAADIRSHINELSELNDGDLTEQVMTQKLVHLHEDAFGYSFQDFRHEMIKMIDAGLLFTDREGKVWTRNIERTRRMIEQSKQNITAVGGSVPSQNLESK